MQHSSNPLEAIVQMQFMFLKKTRPNPMEIKSAEFIISNTRLDHCPQDGLPEYAFIGRSNVGKSSLINMLTRKPKLAMTSATPGKTMLINHFLEFIEWLGENGIPFSIVFTKADKLGTQRQRENVERYLARLSEQWEELPPHFVTSSEKGIGRDEILGYIEEINKNLG